MFLNITKIYTLNVSTQYSKLNFEDLSNEKSKIFSVLHKNILFPIYKSWLNQSSMILPSRK